VRLLPVDDVADDVVHAPASISASLILTYDTDIPGLPHREKISLLVRFAHSTRRVIVTAFSSLRKNHADTRTPRGR
jgi:hypothetical protein